MSNVMVLYHEDCPDGFTGAWVMNRFFKSEDITPELYACKYHQTPPDVTGKSVYMVDFCYDDLSQMKTLIEQAESFLLLDHHRTGETLVRDLHFLEDVIEDAEQFGLYEDVAWLQDTVGFGSILPPGDIHLVVDQTHSGAMLAAYYTKFANLSDHPSDVIGEPQEFVYYVEDRDMWWHHLPMTQEINAAIMSYDYSFDTWNGFATDERVSQLQVEGEPIVRYRNKLIDGQVRLAQSVKINGIKMLGAPAPHTVASDVAGVLAERSESGIGVYWVDYPGMRKYGLRSTPDGPDVAEISSLYGGNGHTHAAGFSVKGKVGVDVD